MAICRPLGTINIMRTSEEKEKTVLEYLNEEIGCAAIARNYGISKRLFEIWIKKYRESGIDGLRPKTGKSQNGNKGRYKQNL